MFLVEDSRPSLGKTCHEIYKKRPFQNLDSLSGKVYYDQIPWTIEATRLGFKIVVLLWNFTGTLTALWSKCLLNFRAINLEWMMGWFRRLLFIIATGLRNWLDALAMDMVQARWNCSRTGSILDRKSSTDFYILSNNNLHFHIFSWYINHAYIFSCQWLTSPQNWKWLAPMFPNDITDMILFERPRLWS